MAIEYTAGVMAELHARVAQNLGRWSLPPATGIELLNVSENATFALKGPGGRDWVLRLHRVGYSTLEEIRSELAWMEALRRDGVIETAPPIPGADGDWVQVLTSAAGAPPRFAVAFERLPGSEPDAGAAVGWFERLGEVTAAMHAHSRSWSLPAGFRRKRWDFDAMVGTNGFWGPWRNGIGLHAAGERVIEAALAHIRRGLDGLGEGAEVFGLVHADLRLANLLVDGNHLRVIDFDDCGFSWFLYDFATSISFIEHEAIVPALLRAWCKGYRKSRALSADQAALIPGFVVLRRILLTAWLASHAEVPLARDLGASYTDGTVEIARALLRGQFLNLEP